MNKLHLLLYTLLVFAIADLSAQSHYSQRPKPAFKNFTINDGLPSSEVYDVLQDHNGYLWSGTDRGIAKFDGYEFEVFTNKDGLTGDVVFELYEDDKGRIWYLPFNGDIGYFEKDTIKNYSYNDCLSGYPISYVNSFFVDSLDNMFIGTFDKGTIRISNEGQVTLDTILTNKIGFVEYEDQLHSFCNRIDKRQPDIYYDNLLLKSSLDIGKRTKAGHLSAHLIGFNGRQHIYLYDLDQEEMIHQVSFDERITSFQIIDNKIFVGVELQGMYIYQVKNERFFLLHQLTDKITYSNVEKDHEGGFWFTTIEQGVFYTPNLEVLSYTKATGMERNYVKVLDQHHDNLSISYGNSFQFLNDGKFSAPQIFINPLYSSSEGIINVHDSIIYNRSTKLLDLKAKFRYPNQYVQSIPVLQFIEDDLFIFSRIKGFCRTLDKIVEIDLHRNFSYIEDVEFIDKQHFWIGSTEGFFKRTPTETMAMSTVNPIFSDRIRRIAKTATYGLVLATKNEGIIFYKDEEVKVINTTNSILRTNNIVNIHIDKEEHIWAATNKGLYKVDAHDFTKIDYYSKSDGLISNEIVDVRQIKDKLYVGTKRGLSVIDQTTFQKDTSPVDIKITKIKINDKVMSYQPSIDIYPDDKYIEINYLNFSYNTLGHIDYKYRILGYSNKWQYTKNRTLSIPILADYGVYTLELYAKKTTSDQWTTTPASIQLTFHPPFYKTTTFALTNISLLFLVIYLGFRFNVLSYNKYIQQEITSRLLKRLSVHTYLIININKETIRINTDDILYIQSCKDYVEINTKAKKFLYRSTLKKMQEKLSDLHFIRVHRSYIVRKDRIDSISNRQIVLEKKVIPIGKTYVSSIKKFGNYFDALNK